MKSHLQSYPCPLQINSFWNLGFLLGITIILQIITGIFLGLHYTSDLNSAYSSVFFFIREIYYGWCLRYLHSSGASFVFLFLFLHLGRAISYGSYFYNPKKGKEQCVTAIYFHNLGCHLLVWRSYVHQEIQEKENQECLVNGHPISCLALSFTTRSVNSSKLVDERYE